MDIHSVLSHVRTTRDKETEMITAADIVTLSINLFAATFAVGFAVYQIRGYVREVRKS